MLSHRTVKLWRQAAAAVRCFTTSSIASNELRGGPAAVTNKPRKGWIVSQNPADLWETRSQAAQRDAMSNRAKIVALQSRYVGRVSPEAKQLHDKICAGDLEVKQLFTTCIAKQEMTPEIIRTGLKAEYMRLSRHPRRTRIELIRKDDKQLTRLVFEYMLANTARLAELIPMIVNDADTRFYFCYFAVAEGDRPAVEQFILTDLSLLTNPTSDLELPRMRNALLKDLVWALMAIDTEHKADSAIEALFEMRRRMNDIRKSPEGAYLQNMSMRASMRFLAAGLLTGDYRNTETSLWDKFESLYRAYFSGDWRLDRHSHENRDLFVLQFTIAGLEVYRPANPSCGKLLTFLQSRLVVTTPSELVSFRKKIAMADRYLKALLTKASRLAIVEGSEAESQWLEGLIPRLMGIVNEIVWEQREARRS